MEEKTITSIELEISTGNIFLREETRLVFNGQIFGEPKIHRYSLNYSQDIDQLYPEVADRCDTNIRGMITAFKTEALVTRLDAEKAAREEAEKAKQAAAEKAAEEDKKAAVEKAALERVAFDSAVDKRIMELGLIPASK